MHRVAVYFAIRIIALLCGCGDDSAPPATASPGGITPPPGGTTPAPLVLTVPALGGAVQGNAYTSAAITSTGGTGAIHWTSTALPAGLHLSAQTRCERADQWYTDDWLRWVWSRIGTGSHSLAMMLRSALVAERRNRGPATFPR